MFIFDRMKGFNYIFTGVFILFAALQYNDPDPYLWIPLYLYAAGLCLMAANHKYYPKAYLTGIMIYSIYAVYLFFFKNGVLNWFSEHNAENIAQSMKATKPWIEAAREFFGLAIIIAVLLVNLVVSSRKSSKRFSFTK